MTLKLYAHPFSNNAMRAQLYLDEKGLPYEYVTVDLFKGEHKQPAYLAINPRGQVPCIVDGDITVYESVAIIQYLEHRYPEPALIPSDPTDMATCMRLIGEFHQKLDPTNIFGSVKFRGMRRAELGERLEKLLNECRTWEGYLGDAPYFAGQAYSIADIVVLPFFGMVIDGLGLPQRDFPRLHAWYERCKERPSVAKQPWFSAFASEKANADQHVLAE
ncbi:MAG: glutathione S-transferase family protein [Polyangiales bacterium]|nr:glutathione S-transferase family protein [Myxococcales bacterium]MCB9659527.1 glutathione S-transferase family protein [Sandaracinaceae bacterium]